MPTLEQLFARQAQCLKALVADDAVKQEIIGIHKESQRRRNHRKNYYTPRLLCFHFPIFAVTGSRVNSI